MVGDVDCILEEKKIMAICLTNLKEFSVGGKVFQKIIICFVKVFLVKSFFNLNLKKFKN